MTKTSRVRTTVAVAVAVTLALLALAWSVTGGSVPRATAVEQALERAPEGAEFDLGDQTPFAWSHVAIIAPYAPADEVAALAGAPVPRSVAGLAADTDAHLVLLFLDGDRTVAHALVDRGRIELLPLADTVLDREDAVVRVVARSAAQEQLWSDRVLVRAPAT